MWGPNCFQYHPGQELDIDGGVAEEWIRTKKAEPIIETATVEPADKQTATRKYNRISKSV
jgi:hypothetical protein